MRHGLEYVPLPEVAERIWKRWFISGGKSSKAPYRMLPMHSEKGRRDLWELCIAANFVEVFLAREEHGGVVGRRCSLC